jgi:serine/threonine protein kinase/Flp pilus assembly protein TadD
MISPHAENRLRNLGPERWPRVKDLFQRARAHAPEDRDRFLDETCASDEGLRREVESLLASAQAEALLERPAAQVFDSLHTFSSLEGRSLGPYRLSARIGAGGMGEIYKANDARLDRTVAIKVLPAHIAADPHARERFEREARAIAALNHPHICALYDVGSADGIDFLVMEYLDGETLAARLQRGWLSMANALEYASQIATALDAAHRAGIVHRDFKPANVMLTPGGAKLVDFGIAKQLSRIVATESRETGADLTAPGIILGTPHYMAPELIEGNDADVRTDIYAFGLVFYEMLAGKKASTLPQPVTRLRTDAPEAVDEIIARCLAEDPDQRWQSAASLLEELQRLEEGRGHNPADSIAVLPFTNTGGADAEYLSDGIAETLINNLTGIARLRVVPRSTVVRYKRTELDPPALGRELHARLLLTGKVMQRGDRLMVQADLVDAVRRKQLWGERFNRPAADIFEVEEQIARQIMERLRVELSGDEKNQIAARYTKDPVAYDLYLKARHHWARRTPASIGRAIEYLEAAIARDANFARGWAALADTRILLGWYGAGPVQQLFDSAISAARTAVGLDPDLGEAHAALGFALCCTGSWDHGLRECERAVHLNPEYFLAHDWLALPLSALGRFDEALVAIERAKRLEPLSLVVHHHEAWVNVMAGRIADAAHAARQALELDADYSFGWWWLGIAQTELGQTTDAVHSLVRARDIFGDLQIGISALGHAYGRDGRRKDAMACMQALTNRDPACTDPYHVALVQAGLGETDRAIVSLTEASARDSVWLRIYGPHDPRLKSLRGDPRLHDLVSPSR